MDINKIWAVYFSPAGSIYKMGTTKKTYHLHRAHRLLYGSSIRSDAVLLF